MFKKYKKFIHIKTKIPAAVVAADSNVVVRLSVAAVERNATTPRWSIHHRSLLAAVVAVSYKRFAWTTAAVRAFPNSRRAVG